MAKERPEWKDSKYADAEGKFKELSCDALADWLIKSRKGNKISPKKPKVAGRRATRGYGKAFKGR